MFTQLWIKLTYVCVCTIKYSSMYCHSLFSTVLPIFLNEVCDTFECYQFSLCANQLRGIEANKAKSSIFYKISRHHCYYLTHWKSQNCLKEYSSCCSLRDKFIAWRIHRLLLWAKFHEKHWKKNLTQICVVRNISLITSSLAFPVNE